MRLRMRFQAEKRPEQRALKREVYVSLNGKYRLRIRKAASESQRGFLSTEGNREPWGVVYKTCIK